MTNPLTKRIQALEAEQKMLVEHGARLDDERNKVLNRVVENRGALKELRDLLQILREKKHEEV